MKFDSPQEVFDHVVTSLVKQGQPSMAVRGGALVCVYRGKAGRKCAAGWCIDDALYSERMEGNRIRSIVGTPSWSPSAEGEKLTHLRPYIGLIDELQRAHDDPVREPYGALPWLEAFVTEARKIADRFNLKVKALNAAVKAHIET